MARLSLAWLCALACACGGGPVEDVSPLESTDTGLTCTGDSELYIVAHQDDDLLFMNPDILHGIQAGKRVRTVYVTAGDGGRGESYWGSREDGIRAAYARMAGVDDTWVRGFKTVAGKTFHLDTLAGATRVSVAFLRLPDGSLHGKGYRATGSVSLEMLWKGQVPRMTSLDGATAYSRAELVEVLSALMADAGSVCIGTLDGSEQYGNDHSDHRHVAKFAFEAQRASESRPLRFNQYRGYNIQTEPENLSVTAHDAKWSVFSTYARHDEHLCAHGGTDCLPSSPYAAWAWRQYAVSAVRGLRGSLRGLGGMCLGVREGASENGTPAQLSVCADVPGQRWRLEDDGHLRGPGGRCLDVRDGDSANGAPVQLWDCADMPQQHWSLMGDGQLRGLGGKCLDVRGGVASNGTPVQLWDCTGVSQQQWSLQFGRARGWASGGPFSNGASPGSFGFSLADVNGDGAADACARRQDGLHCAFNDGGGAFDAPRLVLAAFTDAQGWARPEAGGTVQFGDLDHDGRADVCGRGPDGLVCALASDGDDSAVFGEPSLWSPEFALTADTGEPAGAWRFLRLADVNGDGFSDVCGPASDGIRCALNDGAGHFAPSTLWLRVKASRARGWAWPGLGGTLQFGDLNHDGRADLCGRSRDGIRCALARRTGSGFEEVHLWSFRADFSDAGGWGGAPGGYDSIRLADINGDGFADVCGRAPGGIVCGLSNGSSFEQALPLLARDATDAQGWLGESCGASLQFGDLDGDGHADVCGWGTSQLLCALAP